jgi:hypothetical protein
MHFDALCRIPSSRASTCSFTTSRASIWDRFFEKLEEDREAILQSTKNYAPSRELQDLKWNGREIRNIGLTSLNVGARAGKGAARRREDQPRRIDLAEYDSLADSNIGSLGGILDGILGGRTLLRIGTRLL